MKKKHTAHCRADLYQQNVKHTVFLLE